MVKAKTPTWQQLRDRGGPYTVEELRVLYDRPGMNRLGNNAWCCDTCGAIRGMYTSMDVDAYHRERGTFIERVGPTPPESVQALEERARHTREVWEDIGREIANAYAEITKINNAHSSRRGPTIGVMDDGGAERQRAARVAMVQARIDELQVAQEQAAVPMGEAGDAYVQAFAAWREELRQEEDRAAREHDAVIEPPKRNALERFLAGALKG